MGLGLSLEEGCRKGGVGRGAWDVFACCTLITGVQRKEVGGRMVAESPREARRGAWSGII